MITTLARTHAHGGTRLAIPASVIVLEASRVESLFSGVEPSSRRRRQRHRRECMAVGPRLKDPTPYVPMHGYLPIPDRVIEQGIVPRPVPIECQAACAAPEPVTATTDEPQNAIRNELRSPRVLRRQAKKRERKLRRRMENAEARGDTKTATYLRNIYTRSLSARYAAVLNAAKDLHRNGKNPPGGIEALRAAESLDVNTSPSEPVHVFRTRKANGRSRTIHAFGLLHRARQHVVVSAMRPFLKVDPRQHATVNNGLSAACRSVMEHMQTAGWAVEADIANFYPSVNQDWLCQNLPLDARASTSTILVKDAEKACRANQYDIEVGMGPISIYADAQHGLPQGASSSSLAADRVVAEIMKSIPAEMRIVNFADNFLILADTRAELERSLQVLQAAVRRCPAGQLSLTAKKMRRLADGVDFLGYRFRNRRSGPTAVPSSKNVTKFQWRVADQLRRILHKGRGKARLRQIITSWRSAFSLYVGIEFFVFALLRDLFLAVPEGEALRREVISIRRRLPACA